MSDAAPKTLVEDRGLVRILTINNVKQRNALTMDVKAVFGPALAGLETVTMVSTSSRMKTDSESDKFCFQKFAQTSALVEPSETDFS